jgi:hypothetical protein
LTLESPVELEGIASDGDASQDQALWASRGALRSEGF